MDNKKDDLNKETGNFYSDHYDEFAKITSKKIYKTFIENIPKHNINSLFPLTENTDFSDMDTVNSMDINGLTVVDKGDVLIINDKKVELPKKVRSKRGPNNLKVNKNQITINGFVYDENTGGFYRRWFTDLVNVLLWANPLVFIYSFVSSIKRVDFIFAWFDVWVGFYWDQKKRWLYFLPLPCVGLVFKFKEKEK